MPSMCTNTFVCNKPWTVVFVAQAELKMQQQLGELYSQVDTLQSRLHEADAKEQTLQAKLENAEHEARSDG